MPFTFYVLMCLHLGTHWHAATGNVHQAKRWCVYELLERSSGVCRCEPVIQILDQH